MAREWEREGKGEARLVSEVKKKEKVKWGWSEGERTGKGWVRSGLKREMVGWAEEREVRDKVGKDCSERVG